MSQKDIGNKIPIYKKLTNYEPNFIILSSGQSNAGGWDSKYDLNMFLAKKIKI